MGDDTLVGYVVGSSVRRDVLRTIASGTTDTDAVLSELSASESAVYNAFTALNRRGLLRSTDGGWAVTGRGRVVADFLAHQRDLCGLLADDYWETHDTAALPRRFRIRLAELAGAEIVRASETDPHAVVREIAARVANATAADIVSPVYHTEYDESMPDSEDARLVVNRAIVEEALAGTDDPAEVDTYERTSVRILDVDVALGITGGTLLLSLPTVDGQYDSRTEVIGEGDRAIAWGRDLFDYYWDRATPVAEFVGEHRP